jgi:hypothetical protein
MARMIAHDISASTVDRDGWWDCWPDGGIPGPLSRVGTIRRGWTNIVDNGGKEAIVTHTGLEVEAASAQCSGIWATTTTGNTAHLWPKTASTGTSNIHIIHANSSVPTSILYSRSTDGGATFDKVGVEFATAGTYTANADMYDIGSSGSKVGAVIASFLGDIILVESTDDGGTWSQSTIYDVDETYLTEQDVPDGSCAVIYDNDGDVHVVWAGYYASGEGPDSIFYSTGAGIHHWSAATGDQLIGLPPADAVLPQLTGPSFVATRNGAIAFQPDIAVDANDNLCVVYQAWTSELDALGDPQEHIFGVGSTDEGASWDDEVDVTPGTGFSATYPSLADVVDDDVDMVYNCDIYSGSWVYDGLVAGDHPHIFVDVMYHQIPKEDFDPLSCNDFTSRLGRCTANGTIQARYLMLNDNTHAGETIQIAIDEDVFVAVIGTNGTHSRGQISVPGYMGTGSHTLTLVDPSGCSNVLPLVVTCAGSDEAANAEWEASDALWGEGNTDVAVAPAETRLLGNYPNPFNPSTTIRYELSADTRVSVKVYNMLGQEVATLFDGIQKAGEQSVVWNGTNNAGHQVASGLYLYKIQTGNIVLTEKMLFAR